MVGFGVSGESRGRKRPHLAPHAGGAGSQLFPHPPPAGDSVASSYMALQGSVLEKQVGREKQEPRKVLEQRADMMKEMLREAKLAWMSGRVAGRRDQT